MARNGAELAALFNSLNLTGAYTIEVQRGTENYLYCIKNGTLVVINLGSGVLGTVTYTGTALAYLGTDTGYVGDDQIGYCHQTVDDFTFVGKRGSKPAMKPDLSPSRPYEGMVFFRSGNYSTQYRLSLTRADGLRITYTYSTPDNSTAANAPYIGTNSICQTFYDALNGGGAGGVAATGKGWSVELNGNLLRIWRDDGQDWTLFVSDGAGGAGMQSFKGSVSTITKLPVGGFEGFVLGVSGAANGNTSPQDFYVKFTKGSASTGQWVECVRPNTPTSLDPATMPHAIVNTGLNTFTVQPLIWSDRICGDGVLTAVNPGFVGKPLQDLFWDNSRLGFLTQGSITWSKARNAFTLFPETLQALLDDAPIDITVAASESVALLKRKLQVDESLYLWAQFAQFRVTQGQNAIFNQSSVSAKEGSAYQFSERANFAKVARTVYFATDNDGKVTMRSLTYDGGKQSSETDVTAHIPSYILGNAQQLAVSDTGQMVVMRASAANLLFIYNFLVQGEDVVQSAWNTWRLPDGCTLIWVGIRNQTMRLVLQRAQGVFYVTVPLNPHLTDVVTGATYRTRLDFRMNDLGLITKTFTPDADGGVGTTTISGYQLQALSPSELASLRVVARDNGGGHPRGQSFPVLSYTPGNPSTIVIRGNATATSLYIGLRISSERTESEFFIRGKGGVTYTERLTVHSVELRFDSTGYSRIEGNIGQGRQLREYSKFLELGTDFTALGTVPVLKRGKLSMDVKEASEATVIRFVNDSHLPSRWTSCQYDYEATIRTAPDATASAAGSGA